MKPFNCFRFFLLTTKFYKIQTNQKTFNRYVNILKRKDFCIFARYTKREEEKIWRQEMETHMF